MPHDRRAIAVPALVACLLVGCAGPGEPAAAPVATPVTPATPSTPSTPSPTPLDVGHGSVEEVTAALAKQGLPCTDIAPAPLGEFEQVISCTIEGSRVTLVHFFSVEQASAYESAQRGKGMPGVYSRTWAAQVPTTELARRMSAAIRGTTFS